MNKDTKIAAVLLIAFVVLFVPPIVEIILYSRGPFLVWRIGFEEINLAKWQMVCYIVFLWFFAFCFLYVAARLIWHRLKLHK